MIRSAFWLGATGLGILLVKALRPAQYTYTQAQAVLGEPDSFALPSVTFFAAYQAWLIRNPQGFYALKAVCPHLGCKPDWRADTGAFLCPCHGSRFAADGSLLQGPSLKPLQRLPLRWDNKQIALVLDENVTAAAETFLPYGNAS